jgi:hypothetical protein
VAVNIIELYEDPNIADKFLELLTEKEFQPKGNFLINFVDRIVLSNVRKCEIDFTQINTMEIVEDTNRIERRQFSKMHGQDRILFAQ